MWCCNFTRLLIIIIERHRLLCLVHGTHSIDALSRTLFELVGSWEHETLSWRWIWSIERQDRLMCGYPRKFNISIHVHETDLFYLMRNNHAEVVQPQDVVHLKILELIDKSPVRVRWVDPIVDSHFSWFFVYFFLWPAIWSNIVKSDSEHFVHIFY